MMNKGLDILTIKDYSVDLETLPTDKLKKLLHVVVDDILSQRELLAETEIYAETLRIILNRRGEQLWSINTHKNLQTS